MRLDSSLAFVAAGAPLSLVAAAGIAVDSAVVDLIGSGPGTAPPSIIGNVATFGQDPGVGDGFLVPKLLVTVGTALVTANVATLQVVLQGAPDLGVGGGYLPGAWQDLVESPAMTPAQALANPVVARFDWPPVFPENLRPRYFRLEFRVPAATNFTAGTISAAYVTTVRDDLANKQAANNFVVA